MCTAKNSYISRFYLLNQLYYFMSKIQSIDDFNFNSVIGKGTYAKVCLVTRKADGEVFALKVLKKKYIIQKNQEEHIMT